MRLIDADAFDKVLEDAQIQCKRNGGNFRFGVLSRVRANLKNAPTVGEGMAEALDCYRRQFQHDGWIICEQKKCKWRCEGRNVGLDHGYCASNNLLGDVVRLLGGIPGEGAVLRGKID